MEKLINENMEKLIKDIRQTNDKNGWLIPQNAWHLEYFIPNKIALIHSEVSESLEAFRKDDYSNFAEELADIVIRVLDLASGLDIDIETIIKIKIIKNSKRGFKHGGKRV